MGVDSFKFVKLEKFDSIQILSICDEVNKNVFTNDLVNELSIVFEEIKNNRNIKVLIVTGYGNYFCCGGSKEELERIINQDMTFESIPFYKILFDLEIPTIAAMQGHSIGGGLVFGLYADFVLLARESIYSANFMKYGFTPGMGGTFIVPHKFGPLLGNEMLYSAEGYQGAVIEKRLSGVRVSKRQDVLDEALSLAKELSRMPIKSLKALKKSLKAGIKDQLEEAVERELSSHSNIFSDRELRFEIDQLINKY